MLTEKYWKYTIPQELANTFRTAIENNDLDGLKESIDRIYSWMLEEELIDNDDYKSYSEPVIAAEDEADLNHELSDLYDLCDNLAIWIPLYDEVAEEDEEIESEESSEEIEAEEESLEEDLDSDEKEAIEDKTPEIGPDLGLSTLLIQAINDEWNTIEFYNNLIATAEQEGHEDIVAVVRDINTEENIHVGQLQELLKKLSPITDNIEKGEEEAEEQIGEMK